MSMENAVIAGYPIVLPAHRAAFHREHPDWHKAWLDSIHRSLKPDDVVIDVGAEQGDLSALIASWLPDGGIVLVEPQPLFWPTIRETFEANGLKPFMAVEGYADEVSSGYVQYGDSVWPASADGINPTDPGFYHLNEHPATKAAVDDFPVVVSALTIDVEGSELYVLRGAELTLKEQRPQVWCAIHPEIMRDRYGHDPNDLMRFMRDLGYEAELLGFQGEVHARFYPA